MCYTVLGTCEILFIVIQNMNPCIYLPILHLVREPHQSLLPLRICKVLNAEVFSFLFTRCYTVLVETVQVLTGF